VYAGFEKALEAAVASGRIAGAVAAVADRDGVTYTRQAGVRQAGEPAAMTQDTIFWLASMTKAVVSVAALREVEAGRLSLDGDLSGLLPEFSGLKVLEGFGEDGTPRLRPARRAPTLRDLLTHTSGFGYAFLSADLTRWHASTGAADPNGGTRAAHVLPLLHDPGEAWSYGIGIDWAGLAVEAASGQRLDAYLAEHILGPEPPRRGAPAGGGDPLPRPDPARRDGDRGAFGRRRPSRHGAGLPPLPAHAAERRRAGRGAGAEAGDRARTQRGADRRAESRGLQDGQRRPDHGLRPLPEHAYGPRPRHRRHTGGDEGGAQSRRPELGGDLQHLFLGGP